MTSRENTSKAEIKRSQYSLSFLLLLMVVASWYFVVIKILINNQEPLFQQRYVWAAFGAIPIAWLPFFTAILKTRRHRILFVRFQIIALGLLMLFSGWVGWANRGGGLHAGVACWLFWLVIATCLFWAIHHVEQRIRRNYI